MFNIYNDIYTHMPFYFKEIDEILFCYKNNTEKKWRPARHNILTNKLIDINLLPNYTFCNLYGYLKNDIINISYVAYKEGPRINSVFNLYNAQFDLDWHLIENKVIQTPEKLWNACSDDKHHYIVDANRITIYDRSLNMVKRYQFPKFNTIYRILRTHNNNLLITADVKNVFESFVFNLNSERFYRIILNDKNKSIYKCCFYKDNQIIHSCKEKQSDHVDRSHLNISKYELILDTKIPIIKFNTTLE